MLGPLAGIHQQEVKWHLLQILPRLDLSDPELETAATIADSTLQHESRIVQAAALSALFSLAQAEPKLLDRAREAAAAAGLTSGQSTRAEPVARRIGFRPLLRFPRELR